MLIVSRKVLNFRIAEVYFAATPFEMNEFDLVKYHFCNQASNIDGFSSSTTFTSVIDLNQDLNAIWNNFDRKSTRYCIKKANQEGIKFKINKDYKEFYDIYKNFLVTKNLSSLFKTNYISLDSMMKFGTLFTSYFNDELLGGHLYLEDENNIILWISASNRLDVGKKKAAVIGNGNRLLHWEAIKYAKQKGLNKFDWGGIWSDIETQSDRDKYSINSFKLSFGGIKEIRYNYDKIYSKKYALIKKLYKGLYNWC